MENYTSKNIYNSDYSDDPFSVVPPRKGCIDIWNAFMVKGAVFSEHDIPFCPTYLPNGLPKSFISYSKAKTIFNKEMSRGNKDFHIDAFIHFEIDDHKFDGKKSSIWLYPEKAIKIIQHFAGIVSPDFSTYADFPDPIKRFNIYRMRAFAYWCYNQGIPVLHNARWGTHETWEYCFDGMPSESVVFIGTVASRINQLENRHDFETGLYKLVEVLNPKTIIVYGSANYDFFINLQIKGINIISFQGDTDMAYKGGSIYE